MKFVLFAVTLLLLVTFTLGFVCPKNYCKNTDCSSFPQQESDCLKAQDNGKEMEKMPGKYVYTEKASFCGCCSMCIRLFGEGEPCSVIHSMVAKSRCDDGLRCNRETMKCEKLSQPNEH